MGSYRSLYGFYLKGPARYLLMGVRNVVPSQPTIRKPPVPGGFQLLLAAGGPEARASASKQLLAKPRNVGAVIIRIWLWGPIIL